MASATQPSTLAVSPGDVYSDANVLQLIQTHQEKTARLPPLEEIKTVLHCSVRGMRSTFSQAFLLKHEGYPSGSMVDFACDVDRSPILAVSNLATHAKDLLANPKCLLLVARDPEDRTDLVITLHGDAVSVLEEERTAIRTAYLAKHPKSNAFSELHLLCLDQEFSKPVAGHMNRDHSEHTRLIVQHSTSIPVDSAYMLDINSLGFNVKAVYQGSTYKLCIPFPRRAEDRSCGNASSCLVKLIDKRVLQRNEDSAANLMSRHSFLTNDMDVQGLLESKQISRYINVKRENNHLKSWQLSFDVLL